MQALVVCDLNKRFGGVQALAGVSFSVEPGEILGIFGPNGSGKTTLFNVLSGFIAPDSGSARLSGIEISGKAPHELFRMGVVRSFQDLRLPLRLPVIDNLLLALTPSGADGLLSATMSLRSDKLAETAMRTEAMTILRDLGLEAEANYPTGELSFGDRRLLAIACCIAAQRRVTLLDEPFGGVSSDGIDRIIELIRRIRTSRRSAVLIEHNVDALSQVCDRLLFMRHGKIVCEGPAFDIKADSRVAQEYFA